MLRWCFLSVLVGVWASSAWGQAGVAAHDQHAARARHLFNEGDAAGAEAAYLQALNSATQALGAENPLAKALKEEVAKFYDQQGKMTQATNVRIGAEVMPIIKPGTPAIGAPMAVLPSSSSTAPISAPAPAAPAAAAVPPALGGAPTPPSPAPIAAAAMPSILPPTDGSPAAPANPLLPEPVEGAPAEGDYEEAWGSEGEGEYYSTEMTAEEEAMLAAMAGGFMGLLIVILILALIVWIAMAFIFAKAGYPAWGIIIPVYNLYLLCKVSGLPGWFVIPWIFSPIGFIIQLIQPFGLARRFDKGFLFGAGLLFLPFIFYPILAFGSAEFISD